MRLKREEAYKLLSPRPTVAVTTFNSVGVVNACVVSFVSPISFNPPIVMISLAPVRHTYKNIEKTGEFVINILGKERIDQLLRCAAKYQEGVNKLQQAGLRWYSSKLVKPPRIREAKAWLECKVIENKKVGDHIVVFGQVLAVEVSDDCVTNGEIDLRKINPVTHVTKDIFATDFKLVKHKRYD